jgi:conjugative transposon TraK protein
MAQDHIYLLDQG